MLTALLHPFLAGLVGVAMTLAVVGLHLLRSQRLLRTVQHRNVELEAAVRDRTAELEASRRQLEHKDRLASLGTLAAGVAHEINNPLAVVVMNLALLREEIPRAREAAHFVHDASVGAARVQRIVRDLLAFSATTLEETELVDLDQAVDTALAIVAGLLAPRATVERTRTPAPPVRATRVRVEQVLMNLLSNAAQALPEGRSRENRIRVLTGTTEAGEAFVTIADNGPGISPEVLPRIFEPFFTTKPAGLGTGLGLAICHGIATTMSGRLTVESTPGQGAAFTLTVPAASPAVEVVGNGPVPPEPGRAPRRRVLIVDDDEAMCKMLARVLRPHDVVIEQRGKDALARCRESSFDLVLCDLGLPDMSGIDVYRELVTLGLGSRVIIVSGGAADETVRRFLESSSVRQIAKPFDIAVLRRLMQDPSDPLDDPEDS